MRSWIFALALVSSPALAQTVDIKDAGSGNDTTTIEIRKGKPTEMKEQAQGAPHDGTAEIEGEPGATEKDARTAWKKSCDDWKKELKAENKDVFGLSCGKATCSGNAGNKTCTSQATYKIKSVVN